MNFTSKSIITLWFFIFPWPYTCHWLQCLCQHQTVSNCPAIPLTLPPSQIPPLLVISYQLEISKASVSHTCEWLKISCGSICPVWRSRIVIECIHFILSSDVLLGKCIHMHMCMYMYVYRCVCMFKIFKYWQCFVSFLLLFNNPEKGSEPFWGSPSPEQRLYWWGTPSHSRFLPSQQRKPGQGEDEQRAKGRSCSLWPTPPWHLNPQAVFAV